MKETHRLAAKHSQQMKERSRMRRNKLPYIPLEIGDRVLIKNLKETGGPGKLRSFWEQDIYRVVTIKEDSGVVFGVQKENDSKSKIRVVHRNILLPCDHLPLELPKGIERIMYPKHQHEASNDVYYWEEESETNPHEIEMDP